MYRIQNLGSNISVGVLMFTIKNQKLVKLKQAKEILTMLGLPNAQCNYRSAWVLCSLSVKNYMLKRQIFSK
jgi:hypothetical protein